MPEETEQETRKRRIDHKLEAIGWKLIKCHESKPLSSYLSHAIEEFPTSNGPVDYALVDRRQIIALVEAKKLGTDPQNVLVQAQRDAQGVREPTFDFDGFRVPFIYSTNGVVFWFQDLRRSDSRSRKVLGFHTPGALREMLGKDVEACCNWFRDNPNRHPRLRPYQIEANDAVEKPYARVNVK
jgi:type I restriction enzyme R subunit